jgi:hypothetical protein
MTPLPPVPTHQSNVTPPGPSTAGGGRSGAAEGAVIRAVQQLEVGATEVSLSWKLIGNEGAAALAGALSGSAISSLNLEWNRIGETGALALARALSACPSLTLLSLGGNCLADVGTRAVAEALSVTRSVISLDLSWNRIGTDGARALADALRTGLPLAILDLGNNWFGDASADAWAAALRDPATEALSQLNLAGTRLSDVGAATLAPALRDRAARGDGLLSIGLWKTQMTEAGVSALTHACGDGDVVSVLGSEPPPAWGQPVLGTPRPSMFFSSSPSIRAHGMENALAAAAGLPALSVAASSSNHAFRLSFSAEGAEVRELPVDGDRSVSSGSIDDDLDELPEPVPLGLLERG